MKNLRKDMKKRPAFTLVELLIVIIIIGILSGSMMLIAGSGTDKAEATRIVSDLRTIKSASLMYYSEEGTWADDIEKLEPFLDKNLASTDFAIVGSTDNYIEYANTGLGGGIQGQLKKIADKEGNLFRADDGNDLPYESGTKVYMRLK